MKESRPAKGYFSLIIGIAFLIYGGYRLYTFYMGEPYNTFRIIVAIIFVLLGTWDIYRFFRTRRIKKG
ncbi:hypothetical protein [Salinimicrobium gaetbulicola]|uniref:Uncharacterized protein n=1 Tax=Salinimicrobium gaetbulicola TaxID=999702 RepID=A0ABW3IDG3_9FLAO